MRRILVAAVATGVALFGQASLAQPGPPSFDALDTDENGELSKEEVSAMLARRQGGGGRGEGRGPSVDMVFGRWDADSSGAISREEFDNRPRRGGGQGRRQGN